jgi:ornithine carbamoyltransferase
VVKEFADPHEACKGAHLVTTDVWTSMGYEAENEERRKAFADWCVDQDMMTQATPEALFMHCLPAHRGEEITDEVIEGPQSVVWAEATLTHATAKRVVSNDFIFMSINV